MSKADDVEQVVIFDLGSARTKILVAEKNADGSLNYFKSSIETSLSKLPMNEADSEVIQKYTKALYEAVVELSKQIKSGLKTRVITVATQAIRRANGHFAPVLEQLKPIIGEVNVLSPEKEGRIFFKGLLKKYGEEALQNAVLVDIGGGSVQVVWREDNQTKFGSYPMGTYSLEREFKISGIPLNDDMENKITKYISSFINTLPKLAKVEKVIMGSNCMQDFMNTAYKKAGIIWDGKEMKRADVQQLLNELKGRPYADLAGYYPQNPMLLYGMDKALIIISLLSEYFDCDKIVPTDESLSTAMVEMAFNNPEKLDEIFND